MWWWGPTHCPGTLAGCGVEAGLCIAIALGRVDEEGVHFDEDSATRNGTGSVAYHGFKQMLNLCFCLMVDMTREGQQYPGW